MTQLEKLQAREKELVGEVQKLIEAAQNYQGQLQAINQRGQQIDGALVELRRMIAEEQVPPIEPTKEIPTQA